MTSDAKSPRFEPDLLKVLVRLMARRLAREIVNAGEHRLNPSRSPEHCPAQVVERRTGEK